MEALKTCRNLGSLKRTLETLPSGLNEMYKLTLERINAQPEEDARLGNLALMWVCHAYRRLTVRQLQEALATSYTPGSFQLGRYVEENLTKWELIAAASGGLLTVDDIGEVRLIRKFNVQASLSVRNDHTS